MNNVLERGCYSTVILLDSVTLTASFADNESEAFRLSPLGQVELSLIYTEDATETNNSAVIKILLSGDGDAYEEYAVRQDGSPSGGVVESTLHRLRFLVQGNPGAPEDRWYALPSKAKWMKIAAMEKGLVSAGGTLTVKVRLSDEPNL